jgi:hypothetical protein
MNKYKKIGGKVDSFGEWDGRKVSGKLSICFVFQFLQTVGMWYWTLV